MDPNYEPITERLRGVPLDDWSDADCEEEQAALCARGDEYKQKAETIKWLLDLCAPLSAKFPGTPVVELVHLLPEPDRSIAFDILHPPPVKWADLPTERTNRKEWHTAVEKAIVTLNRAQRVYKLTEVLEIAGIPRTDAELSSAALKYATSILEACQ